MLISGVRRKGPISTLSSLAAIVLLSVAACETAAPALGPEAPLEVAASRSLQLSEVQWQRYTGGPGAPRIFVDGERIDGRDPDLALEGLDRDDVESVEVIKGPRATELYGVDGSSGVVLINLKSRVGASATLPLLAPGVAGQTGTITGRVLDAQSSQTIPAAQVFIATLDIGVLSQENGTYTLANVPVGTRPVTVRKTGYGPVTVNVTVADGQTTALDFRITEQALQLNTSGPRRP